MQCYELEQTGCTNFQSLLFFSAKKNFLVDCNGMEIVKCTNLIHILTLVPGFQKVHTCMCNRAAFKGTTDAYFQRVLVLLHIFIYSYIKHVKSTFGGGKRSCINYHHYNLPF